MALGLFEYNIMGWEVRLGEGFLIYSVETGGGEGEMVQDCGR